MFVAHQIAEAQERESTLSQQVSLLKSELKTSQELVTMYRERNKGLDPREFLRLETEVATLKKQLLEGGLGGKRSVGPYKRPAGIGTVKQEKFKLGDLERRQQDQEKLKKKSASKGGVGKKKASKSKGFDKDPNLKSKAFDKLEVCYPPLS